MPKLEITRGFRIAKAPPHQKVGDSYIYRLTAARVKATPRRAVVRGLLAKIASAEWKDISYEEYMRRKITLTKGMLPPIAAVVAEKLPAAYPDTLRRQTEEAFMKRRETRHKAAAAVIKRGEEAARKLGVTI